jgi:outer membrane protein assembly factor BamB
MRALAAVVVVLLAACATPEPRRLHFGVDEAPEGKGLVWPQPPEVPRYLYAGALTGEANFVSANGKPEGRAKSLLRWLVGLDGAVKQPVVLQRPAMGVADEAGRIYVSDASRQGVYVFDAPAGELKVWEYAEPNRRFVAPSGLARLADGTLAVADAQLGVVARLDPRGAPLASIGRGLLKRPTGVAADAATGHLFVADTYAHDIKVFDAAGQLLATFGARGEAPGEFNYPTYLAYSAGELYVTDTMNSRVQVLDAATGAPLRALGTRGLFVGNLVRPKGVAVDSERNVYVVESYYDHLLVYDRTGRFLMGFGGVGLGSGKFYLPAGVWVDERNRVFVADMFNGRVMVFQFLGGGADGEP